MDIFDKINSEHKENQAPQTASSEYYFEDEKYGKMACYDETKVDDKYKYIEPLFKCEDLGAFAEIRAKKFFKIASKKCPTFDRPAKEKHFQKKIYKKPKPTWKDVQY